MHPTKNDISKPERKKLAEILNQLLADAVDLKSQAKQAHWNVKGETFIALHELFDKVSSEMDGAMDEIAERIMQLGGSAHGTARTAAQKSRLKEYPDVSGAKGHADALSSAMATFSRLPAKPSTPPESLATPSQLTC